MLPMPSAVDVFNAERNSPMVCRVPMVSAKVPAAASSTSHSASGAAALDWGLAWVLALGDLFVMTSLLRRQCGQQRQ